MYMTVDFSNTRLIANIREKQKKVDALMSGRDGVYSFKFVGIGISTGRHTYTDGTVVKIEKAERPVLVSSAKVSFSKQQIVIRINKKEATNE